MFRFFDIQSIIIIIITIVLFVIALFVKGLTHDLLLEAGVLLVSVKLIMMAYKNGLHYTEMKDDLREIKQMLKENSMNKAK